MVTWLCGVAKGGGGPRESERVCRVSSWLAAARGRRGGGELSSCPIPGVKEGPSTRGANGFESPCVGPVVGSCVGPVVGSCVRHARSRILSGTSILNMSLARDSSSVSSSASLSRRSASCSHSSMAASSSAFELSPSSEVGVFGGGACCVGGDQTPLILGEPMGRG